MKQILVFSLIVLLSGVALARDPKVKITSVEINYQIHPKETGEEGRLNAIQQAKPKTIENQELYSNP